MLRSFLLRLAALLAPFALILAFPFFVLWKAGEFMPLEDVVDLQRRGVTTMYGPAYSNGWRHLKEVEVPLRRPKIVALGTSRVMQFRAEFFREPQSFYNAGGAVYSPRQLDGFLTLLGDDRSKQPRLLLVGLDQDFFNSRWQYPPSLLSSFKGLRLVYEAKAFQHSWKLVYGDFFRHKISLPRLVAESRTQRRLGLAAMTNVHGFRTDGSFYYGREIGEVRRGEAPPAIRFAAVMADIDAGREQFKWNSSISPEALDAVRTFAERCQARGIHVVAFLPPYPHAVYARLHGSPHYRYIDQLGPTVGPIFTSRGFTFIDCSDLAALGGSDDEAIDGFHASDKAYVRVLLRLAREDAALRAEVDVDQLQRMLAQAKSPLEVF